MKRHPSICFAAVLLATAMAMCSCAERPGAAAPGTDTLQIQATAGTAEIKETRAPGDFALESVVKGAERHLAPMVFTEIPADELKSLYPSIAALPVEVRGRRAEDGTEYLVMATLDSRDITSKPDVKQALDKDAAERAKDLQMEYRIIAGSVSKYGAVAVSKSDANEMIVTLLRTFDGEYIFN